VAALCNGVRGTSLLCTEDHHCFLAAQRQRHREWFEARPYTPPLFISA